MKHIFLLLSICLSGELYSMNVQFNEATYKLLAVNNQSYKAALTIASGLVYVGSQKDYYNKIFSTRMNEADLVVGAAFTNEKLESNFLTDDITSLKLPPFIPLCLVNGCHENDKLMLPIDGKDVTLECTQESSKYGFKKFEDQLAHMKRKFAKCPNFWGNDAKMLREKNIITENEEHGPNGFKLEQQ